MPACIWYISKYANVPNALDGWGRAFYLLREMSKQGRSCVMISSNSSHLVSTQGPAEPSLEEVIDGVRVIRLRTLKYDASQSKGIRRALSWLDFEWQLFRYSRKISTPPSVIIVSSLSLLTVLTGLLLRRRYNCRLAFEVRDIWPLTLVEEAGFRSSHPMIRLLGLIERVGYLSSDYIVGTMPNLSEHVAEITGKNLQVGFIPMGIEEDWRERQRDVDRAYIAKYIPSDKFIVCYAGTIGLTNALETFFSCARDMQDRLDVHFLIVGSGYLKERYQIACRDLQNVTFAPPIPKAMVQSLLSRCDLLYFAVHQSRVWQFGQSLNKIIDYMLSGKPIVGSYSGYPSMLNEAGSGSFISANNPGSLRREILRYVNMPKRERERMGTAGRMWVLSNRNYKKLATDYLQLISGPSNRGINLSENDH